MTIHNGLRGVPVLLALLLSFAAQAQIYRAYLSGEGADTNPCTLPSPCRLLPAALAAVTSGGEIWILDSANFNTGPVVITKSVSIVAVTGALGSFVALGGPALIIPGGSGIKVALRNVVVTRFTGSGTNGIQMTGGDASLLIEHSLLADLPQNAVMATGAGARVEIADSTIRGSGVYGVYIAEGASANIAATRMLNNAQGGVHARSETAADTVVTVSDSTISHSLEGVYATAWVAGAKSRIVLTRCTIQDVASALHADTTGVGSAIVAVSATLVTNSTSVWYQGGTGAVVRSLGNNHFTENNGSPQGTLTTTPPQ